MTAQPSGAFPSRAIAVRAPASTWQEAISIAGGLLVADGVATEDYTEQMINAVNELGPYIVIAPGIALAHSRPSEAVLRTGLSLATLASPVESGHPRNDPVDPVIGLAALDHDSHLALMAALARVLMDAEALQRIRAAQTHEELCEVLAAASADYGLSEQVK